MGIFLNNRNAYFNYQMVANDPFFVDKTKLIQELIPEIDRSTRFLCFTRPRRFGKSVMANMVAAYFGKAYDSHGLFDGLEISKAAQYQEHLNQHNVIHIDFSRISYDCNDYSSYIAEIQDSLLSDVKTCFPEITLKENESAWNALEKTGQRFIFVLDEWDAIFQMDFMTEQDKKQYLLYLKNLLKDRAYVELAYMTGILPIAKYSGGSELNMVMEYSMVTMERFSAYFGFTDAEVDQLYETYRRKTENGKITRNDLRIWYDGYYNVGGMRLYNPRSIVNALANDQLASYWTSSGPYDEIFHYVKNDVGNIREDIAFMISGEGVPARVREYAATAQELRTKNQIYSAMVVYGLLTYHDGEVSIPNKELMDKFDELLLEKEAAIEQIRKKQYALNFAKEKNYTGRILLVGIGYDSKTKTHACRVEPLEEENV